MTVAILDPKPTLKLDETLSETTECGSEGLKGQVCVGRDYHLNGINKTENSKIAFQIKTFWEKQGWIIVDITGLNTASPFLSARTDTDKFYLDLDSTVSNHLILLSGSPCIWPHGTSEPATSTS